MAYVTAANRRIGRVLVFQNFRYLRNRIAKLACSSIACARIMSTSLQLVLANEVFELLQQARPDAMLHVSALDARGNLLKVQCSLDVEGQLTLDLEGSCEDSMFQISDNTASCIVNSVVHPVYMVMNNFSPHANSSINTGTDNRADNDTVHSGIGGLSDSPLDETVMHMDDIGATNIDLQYSDIEEDGEMVLTSLSDHCYEIADISNDNVGTVLYDDGCTE